MPKIKKTPKTAKLTCHPALLLEDVLKPVFNKLSLEELKECRQVCRKWEESSRNLVKNQSQLRLTVDVQRNLALRKFLRRDFHFFIPSKLKIYIQENKGKGPEFPVAKEDLSPPAPATVNGCTDYDYDSRFEKGVENISEILGHHSFEELEICRSEKEYECPLAPANSLEDVSCYSWYSCFWDLLCILRSEIYSSDTGSRRVKPASRKPPGHLPNILRRLSKSMKSPFTSCIPKNAPSAPTTGGQFLDNCSLVTKISIGTDLGWVQSRILAVSPNLREINGYPDSRLTVLEKAYGGLIKFKGFSCSTKMDLGMLKRKLGNLIELSLEVRNGMGESVLKFLHSKKESLQILELSFRREFPETVRLGLAQGFYQLSKLHLNRTDFSTKEFLLDICFARDTPQLKYFKLEFFSDQDSCTDWRDFLAYKSNIANDGRIIPQETLTHLDLQVVRLDYRECANYLRMLFPSLASLKIKGPTGDFLRGVWQMENLVRIHIDMLADYPWGGGDRYEGTDHLGDILFGTQQDQEDEETILNLKKLGFLRILRRVWNYSNWIPDELVRNGFGKMKRLTVLNLPGLNMTSEAIGFLEANLPYLRELTYYV